MSEITHFRILLLYKMMWHMVLEGCTFVHLITYDTTMKIKF
jgi:hypothetical protein